MKKKLLFVVNNFDVGGPQKSLLSLLYNLDFNKYKIDVVSLSNSGKLLEYLPKEVKIIIPEPIITYSLLRPTNIINNSFKILFSKDFKKIFLGSGSIIKGLYSKKMVQEKQNYWLKVRGNLPKLDSQYDCAFGVSGGHSLMFVTDCVKADKKIGWIRSDYRVLKRNNEIDRIYFNEMNQILSVSEICKEIFLDIFPEASSKTEVFYNILPFKMYDNLPADFSGIQDNPSTLKLLTICRLDPNKGLDLAIDTLELLIQKNINVKWFILGEGKYRKKLEDIIAEKGLKKHFILLGFQLNTAAFIKKADIVVHPSRFEGKSNVVDEAKYLLKPIVVTNYNTVKEQIIHEKTGLISEMNAFSILENIQRIITSPELKEKLILNLRDNQASDIESLIKFSRIVSE